MKLFRLLILAGVVPAAWGAACTTVADGNWSTTGTWGITGCTGASGAGSTPGNGDTVTITKNVTVITDTTIGNSPLDTIGSTPAAPVIALSRTYSGSCGGGTNGQLTINSGVTFTVKGSVSVTGTIYTCSPVINLNPGSNWTFDNTGNPTAVYRIYGLQFNSYTLINAPGTGWGSGQYITINGRNPSCPVGDGTAGTCKNAVWTNEYTTPVAGGTFGTFSHNYHYVKFWYFGSPTDDYRSWYLYANDNNDHGNFFTAVNTEWHSCTGWATGTLFPDQYMNFEVTGLKAVNSIGSNGFFYIAPGALSLAAGKSRIARYLYLDTGFYAPGGTLAFPLFSTVSYIVADGQHKSYGPLSSSSPTVLPSAVDHILVREISTISTARYFGDTSYSVFVVDGGAGNTFSDATESFTTGSHSWVIDHAMWQHGDLTASSDSDPTEPRVSGSTGFPTTWNHFLMLPCAAQGQYECYALGAYGYTATSTNHYNHAVFAFGRSVSSATGIVGKIYIGETDNGTAGTIGIKNSILWNPYTSATGSPIGVHTASGPTLCNSATTADLGLCVANAFDPTQIHHNLVWNYDNTQSQRWTAAITGCSGGAGGNCASYNTPYDYKMTTVPGAHDFWGPPLGSTANSPRFLWQQQGITAPGPREWAHIRFGADIDSSSTPSSCAPTHTCTEVKFETTFAVFANADPSDLTTTAGLKGRVDDLFSWVYGEWASTNVVLRGTADDGGDIGAAPVVGALGCPDNYPAGVITNCNSIADEMLRPADAPPLRKQVRWLRAMAW